MDRKLERAIEMSLVLMYITNNASVALIAEKYGVDRIWIDLETLGKEERQKGMNTVKSKHTVDDIKNIKPLLTKAEVLVRINPWYEGSKKEIEDVISAGADIIMLPMWKTVDEVSDFLKAVNGRCKTVLLLETKEANNCLEEVLKKGGMDEIHIGLNDLHLSYGLDFMFELLSNGTIEKIIQKIAKTGIPYGFGGIAGLGSGDLPAEKIILEHYRLGSSRVILSRSFCNTDLVTESSELENVFKNNMSKLREYEDAVNKMSKAEFVANQKEIKRDVEIIVEKKRKGKR